MNINTQKSAVVLIEFQNQGFSPQAFLLRAIFF
jgi:hypothetical protein